MSGFEGSEAPAVLCRVGTRFCAFPVEHVEETMRPLPLQRLPGMPAFVLGVSVIRGVATPVVDAHRLLDGQASGTPTRFLTLRLNERRVALAVDAVVGVRDLGGDRLQDLPPLLQSAGAEAVASIGTLDAELLLILRGARVVPEPLWAALESSGSS
jgi:purine-binding chemotaxis protein CheW